MDPVQEKIISDIYFDPGHIAGYGGVEKLWQAVKGKGFKKSDVDNWLRNQESYSLHKTAYKKFRRNQTLVSNYEEQYQADLNDMRHLQKYNDGYKYILVVIDCFSRYAWAVPLYTKTGKEVCEAFQKIFAERKPLKLQTDKGKEFLNSHVQSFLKREGIHFFTTQNNDIKAAFAERLNRTLKTRMYKFFTRNNTFRYVEVLPKLVQSYNETVHSTIKMAPAAVGPQNVLEIWRRLYSGRGKHVFTLKIGDHVRISKNKLVFEKGYVGNWSREIFKIVGRSMKSLSPVYKLEDLAGEVILGTFYPKELLKVSLPQTFQVEKILKKRKQRGKLQYFVSWSGYPKSMNSWVDSENVEPLLPHVA